MSDRPDWVADALALCDAAAVPPTHTEVPEVEAWRAEGCDVVTPSGMAYMRGFGGDLIQVAECALPGVAAFIAAARTALPRALTALEAADALAELADRLVRATAEAEPEHASWIPSLRGAITLALAKFKEARR